MSDPADTDGGSRDSPSVRSAADAAPQPADLLRSRPVPSGVPGRGLVGEVLDAGTNTAAAETEKTVIPADPVDTQPARQCDRKDSHPTRPPTPTRDELWLLESNDVQGGFEYAWRWHMHHVLEPWRSS